MSLTAFAVRKQGKDGRQSYCRECQATYKTKHRSYFADRHRLLRYGLAANDYQAMLRDQGGNCLICGEPPKPNSPHRFQRSLHVDHCHATGRIRGLLCQPCNAAVGALRDRADLALAVAAYLSDKPAPQLPCAASVELPVPEADQGA